MSYRLYPRLMSEFIYSIRFQLALVQNGPRDRELDWSEFVYRTGLENSWEYDQFRRFDGIQHPLSHASDQFRRDCLFSIVNFQDTVQGETWKLDSGSSCGESGASQPTQNLPEHAPELLSCAALTFGIMISPTRNSKNFRSLDSDFLARNCSDRQEN